MSVDRYFFPAIFEPGEDNSSMWCVYFPDMGISTEGDSLENAFFMAKEALEGALYFYERDGDNIPTPSHPAGLKYDKGGFVTLIEAWMPHVRDDMESRAVKKTVTLPKWLNDAAESHKINFSKVLQAGLKQKLGIITTDNDRRQKSLTVHKPKGHSVVNEADLEDS